MNKNNFRRALAVLLLLVPATVYLGCKKQTLNNVIPVVKMTSVKMSGADSVIVTGNIVSNNGDSAQYEGFCYGTDPVPPITERQVLFQNSSTTFSARIYVNKDSTYYFRCFAANSYGYAISNPLK